MTVALNRGLLVQKAVQSAGFIFDNRFIYNPQDSKTHTHGWFFKKTVERPNMIGQISGNHLYVYGQGNLVLTKQLAENISSVMGEEVVLHLYQNDKIYPCPDCGTPFGFYAFD